jgi:hypothetical protein
MYIGPWQEYSLSKERKVPNISKNVIKGIEDVLLQSLEPDAAHAALKAMDQFLQQNNESQSVDRKVSPRTQNRPILLPSTYFADKQDFQTIDWNNNDKIPSRPLRPSGPKGSRHPLRHPRIIHLDDSAKARRHLPPLNTDTVHTALDSPSNHVSPAHAASSSPSSTVGSILRIVNSARDAKGRNPSPLSVRSSKSEPIRRSNQLPKLNVPPHPTVPLSSGAVSSDASSLPSSFNQSSSDKKAYDSNAIVNFLRMERNERAKTEIMKLTGWGKGSNGKIQLNPLQKEEEKLQRITHMKELYLPPPKTQKILLDPLQTDSRTIPAKFSFSDSGNGTPVDRSPIIRDIEITEEDLLKVSKYFDSGLGGVTSKSKKDRFAMTDSLTTSLPDSAVLGENEASDGNIHLSSDIQFNYSTFASVEDVGSVDGLLDWTKQLNFDSL